MTDDLSTTDPIEGGYTDLSTPEGVQTVDTPEGESTTTDTPEDAETFPREYVEKLRDENAKYRQRAGQSDELAQRLHLEMVKATGKLADPTDLPYDEEHVRDAPKLLDAIDALLTAKPHMANRKPTGDIGQGVSAASDTFSLSGLLRTNAS